MTVLGAVFGCYFINYALNCIVVCMRWETTMEFGLKKNGTEVGRVGCPWTLLGFRTVKSVSDCVNWINIVHVLCA